MQLYLMRHGEAEPYASSDAGRVLTPYGEAQARAVAAGFAAAGLGFDRILVSPYHRARQTAEPVLAVLAAGGTHETVEWLTPDTVPQIALDALAVETGEQVLLVSHMPLVSRLAGLFLQGREDAGPGFDTAGVLALELEILAQGMGRQHWYRRSNAWGSVS